MEIASIPMRVSPEVLQKWAESMNATVEIGKPDAEGFYEPVFTRKPIQIVRRTGPIPQEDVDDYYGGGVPEGRWAI